MKIVKKITIILMILFLINFCFSNIVKAGSEVDNVINQANNFISTGGGQVGNVLDTAKLTEKLKPVAQALRTIGIGVILCIGAFMGIKWVAAKPDEQAKLKQQSIGLLVAAIVIIGAYTIWSIALKIVSQL